VGTSKGVKLGGTLETYREHITLLARPQHMPRKITVDIASLELGQSFRVSDLVLPEGVRALAKTDFALVAVVTEKDEAETAEASADSASA
jgi:large subunit ribosomal protein L25